MFSQMPGHSWILATYIKLVFGNSLCVFWGDNAGGRAVVALVG